MSVAVIRVVVVVVVCGLFIYPGTFLLRINICFE